MSEFSTQIIDWYQSNKRDLPWRHTVDPFLIWISEIILQQTRVAQGMDYYHKITSRFPDIASLANAQEDEILKLWQGLGYYSRARNMHKAAKQIMEKHSGSFPTDYKDILNLSGIGKYTAAAVSSFAFNQPYAVVDGNVYRVLSRFFGIEEPIDQPRGQKTFEYLSQELLDMKRPGLHNQAVMEFGALQCVPVNPDCSVCPLEQNCIALHSKKIDQLPLKSRKTSIQKLYLVYFFVSSWDQTIIKQRTEKGIWKGLWEFPLYESDTLLSDLEIFSDSFSEQISEIINFPTEHFSISKISEPIKHLLSHREITARFVHIEISDFVSDYPNANLKFIPKADLDKFALHRLMEKYLEKLS